jgi:hypothetical protein
MIGEPIPYFLGNDNLLLLLFITNILGIAYVFILNGNSILQRIKSLFYYSRNSKPYNSQTHINRFCNFILYSQTVLLLSIITFAYAGFARGELYPKEPHIFVGIYLTFFAAIILIKRLIYDIVNLTLFTPQQQRDWRDSYFFTLQLMGFMLLPLTTALLIVPQIPQAICDIYLWTTAIMCLFMLISRCKKIIFNQKVGFVDIILYLCTLEILPTAALIKAVKELNIFLTINF